MERRFQVFVSSTYADLQDERAEVVSMLLNLDALPAGMELFPATNDDAWTLIQRVIDESDYYLLVIGGRYGSVDHESQLSYTEREFDYAVASGKPVMAFLHGDPGKIPAEKTDQSDRARDQLDAFRAKVEDAVHVNYWTGANDLSGLVAKSFTKIQKSHPAVGWVRGDVQTSTESLEELDALRKKLASAEQRLDEARRGPPPGTEDFAQGAEEITLPVRVTGEFTATSYPQSRKRYVNTQVKASWDAIFSAVGPALLYEASQSTMKDKIDSWIVLEAYAEAKVALDQLLAASDHFTGVRVMAGSLFDDDFDTILVQLSALGLIARSERKRSVRDTGAYWTLTPYGEEHLTSLRAIRRKGSRSDTPESAAT